ncbi:hypothetical protein GCK72_020932 [Caenorhabditis remanei]|uniref:Receptor L-domain domain-containing protein n=1 Tax=Caenorhabditis remanei TaxID=31234 RepID=A0A6A5GIE5_CAERE|nr:hypothetical protein GCK72_020932 [Caenorhabditis remanei]KAF1754371.1 hypothetical protein GCK72_020932 [Caenorhabditis remanei]
MIGNEKRNECDFRIENNTRLDMDKYCDTGYFYYYLDMTIRGNLQDCGCPGNQIFEHYLDEYQNCTVLTNGLFLNYFYTSTSLHGLSNIQLVKGKMNIQKMKIQNLSFLENLTTLKIRNLGTGEKIVFNIQDNLKMTRFKIPSLKTIENVEDAGIRLFNFENLHPEFCLTIRELMWFLQQEVSFLNLHATICDDGFGNLDGKTLCHFESMSKLAENCIIILGDLYIGAGDEKYINKLETVKYLFGSLNMRGTNLENFNFLNNLKYIAFLGSGVHSDLKPVIQLISNKNLKNAELSGVTNVLVSNAPFLNSLFKNSIRKARRTAIIQDNHPDIFQHLNGSCNLINTADEVLRYRTALNYSGGNCDPPCVFKHSEVSSKTIKSFPNCSMVYGILVFNQNTDMTSAEIKNGLSKMSILVGGILVENSNLTDLSFITGPWDTFLTLYCKMYGVFIRNNSQLSNLSTMTKAFLHGTDDGECNFEIKNNVKLNVGRVCDEEKLPYYMNMRVEGNLKDCDNHPDIFKDNEGKRRITTFDYEIFLYRLTSEFVGGDCGERVDIIDEKKIEEESSGGYIFGNEFYSFCGFFKARIKFTENVYSIK